MDRCYQHHDRAAVAGCASCGRPLCGDCVEAWEGGSAFCYDCAFDSQLNSYLWKGEDESAGLARDSAERERKSHRAFIAVAASLSALIIAGAVLLLLNRQGPGYTAEVTPEQESMWSRDECALVMQNLRSALAEYRAEKGHYPAGLEELAAFKPSVRTSCPASGAAFRYAGNGQGYSLECPNPGLHGVSSLTADESGIPRWKEVG